MRRLCGPVADRALVQKLQTGESEAWLALLQWLSAQFQPPVLDFLEVDLGVNFHSWCLLVHVVERHE